MLSRKNGEKGRPASKSCSRKHLVDVLVHSDKCCQRWQRRASLSQTEHSLSCLPRATNRRWSGPHPKASHPTAGWRGRRHQLACMAAAGTLPPDNVPHRTQPAAGWSGPHPKASHQCCWLALRGRQMPCTTCAAEGRWAPWETATKLLAGSRRPAGQARGGRPAGSASAGSPARSQAPPKAQRDGAPLIYSSVAAQSAPPFAINIAPLLRPRCDGTPRR